MRKSAPAIYYLIEAMSPFFFAVAFTTNAIYRFEEAGLNPLQLVLLGTMLEGSIFLFEIPTGIVADLKSRRLSVVIGYLLIGIGLILEGSLPLFATILLAQAVWGIGYTFISGAQDAWLADEIGEERLPATYLRGSQISQIGVFVGILVNVGLANVALNLPLLVGGAGHVVLALMLLALMPETGFQPTPSAERSNWQAMGDTFKTGIGVIRSRPLLTTILLISLVYGLYSEALDRLWEAHILDTFSLPAIGELSVVVTFGLFNALIMLITLVTTEVVRRRAEKLNHRQLVRLLAALSGMVALGMVAFGLALNGVMAFAMIGLVQIARRMLMPLFGAWTNRGLTSAVRATVLSTFGQMDAIGQFIGGPAIGLIATQVGLRAALVASGLVLSPVLLLYRRAMGQDPAISAEIAPTPDP